MVYMLTWLGYIDGKCGSIYGIHTDPMGIMLESQSSTIQSYVKTFLWCMANTARNRQRWEAAWRDKTCNGLTVRKTYTSLSNKRFVWVMIVTMHSYNINGKIYCIPFKPAFGRQTHHLQPPWDPPILKGWRSSEGRDVFFPFNHELRAWCSVRNHTQMDG